MDKVLSDDKKIKSFAQIQENLYNLPDNASDSEISTLINQIPQEFLAEREDLIVICQMFARYSRSYVLMSKRNSIKLFNAIMSNIKTNLQNEPELFWNIFGGTYYMQLWMHQQGLIPIDEIIIRAQRYKYPKFVEYFLPEIIEEAPDIFEKEIKYKIDIDYSNDSIEKFKELRSKHFKWLCESSDYNDPSYREIETDSLRLALKTDNIDQFQSIVSNLNITVDTKISESLIENFFIEPDSYSLLEFSILYNSPNILKYLIMNEAAGNDGVYMSIWSRNYEMIHLLESYQKDEFIKRAFYYSITLCNNETAEYASENYDCCPLEKSEFNSDDIDDLLSIIGNTFRSTNFVFLESTLIPFLRKNEEFVSENIFKILCKCADDNSGFFIKEFLKHPKADINLNFNSSTELSLLEYSINKRNNRAIEILLNSPSIILDSNGYRGLSPSVFACAFYSNVKTIDLICNHPNSKVDFDELISSCSLIGNYYVAKYVFDHYGNKDLYISYPLMYHTISKNNIYALELLLKYFIHHNKDITKDDIIHTFKETINDIDVYDEELMNKFTKILLELK